MTAAVLDRPALGGEPAGRSTGERAGRSTGERGAGAHPPAGAHRATLEELLSATLQAARTHGSTECPVCHGAMTSTRAGVCGDASAEALGVAECGACGSRLS